MIYIKDFGEYVQLGGEVATEDMLANGWMPYSGEIPRGTSFKLVDGVLTAVIDEYTVKQMTDAIQNHLDNKAKERGYDNIISACSYAGYPNDFQAEGAAFGTWRSDVWKYAFQVEADVRAGKRPMPTAEELIAELPAFEGYLQ